MADRPAAGLLRIVSTRRIVRTLERDGFEFTERQGSQRIYRHADGRRVVVHYHRANATLPPYVLRNLLIGTDGPRQTCNASASSDSWGWERVKQHVQRTGRLRRRRRRGCP